MLDQRLVLYQGEGTPERYATNARSYREHGDPGLLPKIEGTVRSGMAIRAGLGLRHAQTLVS